MHIPRFKKEFAVSMHQPFPKTSDYIECVRNAYHSKIARLVKIGGMLLQTNVCLFWSKEKRGNEVLPSDEGNAI